MRASAITFMSFIIGFIVTRHLYSDGILFYQGLVLGLLACIAQLCFQLAYGNVTKKDAIKNSLFAYLIIYSFVFTIPTTVDRAYSVKIISKIGTLPDGMDRGEVARFVAHGFVVEGGADRRIAEQLSTGTIQEQGGRYTLTPIGRFINGAFDITRIVFACGQVK